jgi:hypothetical protein
LVVKYGGWREGPWTFYKLPFLVIGSKTKFAAGIIDTGGKFAICINHTSGILVATLPPLSFKPVVRLDLRKSQRIFEKNRMTPVANLPSVSTPPAVPVANLPPLSFKPVVHLELRKSPRIFEKIINDPR